MHDTSRTFLKWLILVALTALGCGAPPASSPPPSSSPTPVDVVVATFENITVEPQLTMALEAAFRAGLERSATAGVLPSERMKEIAAGMGRDPEAGVDRELAREIASEVGAARVVVPRLAPVTAGFTVDAQIVDASTGEVVFEHVEVAIGKRDLLASLGKLTQAVRSELEP